MSMQIILNFNNLMRVNNLLSVETGTSLYVGLKRLTKPVPILVQD